MEEAFSALPPHVLTAIELIWAYHHLHHAIPPSPSTAILALGSNDPRVASRAADLYLAGAAPLLLFSGGVGALTEGLYGGLSEAAYFAGLAERAGVPASAILVEGASTNTGENIRFSRALLEARGVPVHSLILVQKPFMERRTLATFLRQWGGAAPSFVVTSPSIALRDYPLPGGHRLELKDVVEVMCGDLQRIAVYPARGFQVWQEIPPPVWEALKTLVREGYGAHMMRNAGVEAGSREPSDYEGLSAPLPPPEPVKVQ